MKVVDLHPEDLIDKLAAGELTPAERERLNAHISQCRVCRFEIDDKQKRLVNVTARSL